MASRLGCGVSLRAELGAGTHVAARFAPCAAGGVGGRGSQVWGSTFIPSGLGSRVLQLFSPGLCMLISCGDSRSNPPFPGVIPVTLGAPPVSTEDHRLGLVAVSLDNSDQ